MHLLIAESRGFSQDAVELLSRHFDVELADLDRACLLARVGRADVLWVRLRTLVDAEILDRAPSLRAIVTNTTGLNHIDVDETSRREIQVISLWGEVDFLQEIRATAEHTLALTLALVRKLPTAHHDVCQGRWNREPFQGSEVFEKTVGIIGYGRLGRIVARYFQALDARVIIHSRDCPHGTLLDGYACMSLDDVLKDADIVSLHAPWEPVNRHMIGRREFALMKPTACFINTARGELVDETALLDAVEQGRLAGAALDVIDHEHDRNGSFARLARLAATTDRVVATPHVGGFTRESLRKTELFLATKLIREIECSFVGPR